MAGRIGLGGVGFGSTPTSGHGGAGFGNKGGLTPARKACECGRYEPISKAGVIVVACRNCGGEPPSTAIGAAGR